MRIRKKDWIDDELKSSSIYVSESSKLKDVLKDKIKQNNFNKIELEIGTGKGEFISKLAPLNQKTLYIGMDKVQTMLGYASKKIHQEYEKQEQSLNNIILVNGDADYIKYAFLGIKYVNLYNDENGNEILGKNKSNNLETNKMSVESLNEEFKEYKKKILTFKNMNIDEDIKIDRIYINFCNPWPKERHKKRRLLHPRKLIQYLGILKDESEIFFKTDDEQLFKQSIQYVEQLNKYSAFYEKEFEKHIADEYLDFFENIKIKIQKRKKGESIFIPELYVSELTEDLEHDDIFSGKLGNIKENIETEHEKEFKKEGKKIYACIIKRRKNAEI